MYPDERGRDERGKRQQKEKDRRSIDHTHAPPKLARQRKQSRLRDAIYPTIIVAEDIAPTQFARELDRQGLLRAVQGGMEVDAPPTSLTYPSPFADESRVPKKRRLDR